MFAAATVRMQKKQLQYRGTAFKFASAGNDNSNVYADARNKIGKPV